MDFWLHCVLEVDGDFQSPSSNVVSLCHDLESALREIAGWMCHFLSFRDHSLELPICLLPENSFVVFVQFCSFYVGRVNLILVTSSRPDPKVRSRIFRNINLQVLEEGTPYFHLSIHFPKVVLKIYLLIFKFLFFPFLYIQFFLFFGFSIIGVPQGLLICKLEFWQLQKNFIQQ